MRWRDLAIVGSPSPPGVFRSSRPRGSVRKSSGGDAWPAGQEVIGDGVERGPADPVMGVEVLDQALEHEQHLRAS